MYGPCLVMPYLVSFYSFAIILMRKRELVVYFICLPDVWLQCCAVRISFWNLFVLFVNFSVKSLNFFPKWPLSYFQPILAAAFVTMVLVKVKLIPDFYTWAIVLIKQEEEIVEKQLLFLASWRTEISPICT